MLKTPFVSAFVLVVLAAGCGGAGGVRRKMITEDKDAASDVVVLPPFKCASSVEPLNCAAPFRPQADGHVVDFSSREWSSSAGKWCDESGLHGSIFSFKGTAPNDSNAISVNTMDSSLRLSVTVSQGSYGGGGIAFEAGCVDASAFTGLQFSVAVASGSLTGCSYQIQLQTFEQRPTTQNPSGGCDQNTTSCYSFPYVRNVPAASTDPTMPTLVTLPFSMFSASVMPAPAQIVGLQWQVNSVSGMCTVELRIDDVAFIPAAPPPPDGGNDDGGTADVSAIVDADTSG